MPAADNFNLAAQKPALGALVTAVEKNDVEGVRDLLAQGADVNETDECGNSGLIIAVSNGYLEMMQLLLKAGADVKARNDAGYDALSWSLMNSMDFVVPLVAAGGCCEWPE